MLFEFRLTEMNTVNLRIRADSKKEAYKTWDEFLNKESEYLSEELDLNGTKEWTWTELKEVNPSPYDECATITEYEDGTFDAIYEGGDNND